MNFKAIKKCYLYCISIAFSFFTLYAMIFKIEWLVNMTWYFKIPLFLGALIILFLFSLLIVFFRRKQKICKTPNGALMAMYGDIFKIGFENDNKKKCVVIPFNTTFDVIVDDSISKINKPLISVNTLHGQWIKKMIDLGESEDTLSRQIFGSLDNQGIKPLKFFSFSEKKRGNLNAYDIGTIAMVEKNNTTFFLVAISEFDDQNVSQSNRDLIIKAVNSILNIYDHKSQGHPLFIPLIGAGRSRSGVDNKESFQIIKNYCMLHNEKITGDISIVIYPKNKDEVSIFD